MPRGVFNWTAEDVVRFLKARGFSLNNTRGSHWYYVGRASGEFRQVCVPFHGSKPIKPPTVKAIIRQAGMSQKHGVKTE